MKVYVEGVKDFIMVVDGKEYVVDIDKVCGINDQNLKDEFEKFPAIYAWYATIQTIYSNKENELDYQIELLEAQLDRDIRGRYDEKQLKDLKEKQIKSEILDNERYKVISQEILDVKAVVRRLGALVKGLELKSLMLCQIGARVRKEMDLDMIK